MFAGAGVQINSILVATDFSDASEKPLRHAISIAHYYGSKFFLMHVVDSMGCQMVGPEATAAAVEAAWRDLEQVEQTLVASGELAGLVHRAIVCSGDIWTEIEEVIRKERIELVVIGTHSHRGLAKLVLGSVAERIFRQASCLVLTVGPNSPNDACMATTEIDRPVLFATDFGEGSRKALPYAISYANQHQTRLILLHMLPIVPRVEDIGWLTPDHVTRIQEEEQSIARQRLKELIRHSDTRLGVDTIFMPRFGDPAEGIIKTAESFHAEVIVMGLNSAVNADVISHLQRSIAYKVACQAGCAVLTVSG